MAPGTKTSDGSSNADRRREWFRRNRPQRGGRQNQNQNQTHVHGIVETQSNQQLSVPPAQRGRRSRGRNNNRGRGGSPAHGQLALWDDQGYLGRHLVNALSPSPMLLHVQTVAQQETPPQLTIEGVGYVQWQSCTTHSINGAPFLVETSSVLTRTESTGWSSMDYSLPMEVNTPASEPPDPWPSSSGGHSFVGAQFESESARRLAENESSDPTAIFGENLGSSCLGPVIIVTSDGKDDVIKPAGSQNNVSTVEVEADAIDLLSPLPWDMSRAHLDWVKAENWLETIPLGIPRASTFPLMGIYHVDDELVRHCP
jgi:hypothetical protein